MENIVKFQIVRDEKLPPSDHANLSAPSKILEQEFDTIRRASEQLKLGLEAERKKKEALETMVNDIQGEYEGILHSAHRDKIKLTAERNTLEDALKTERRKTRELELTMDNLNSQFQTLKEQFAQVQNMLAEQGIKQQKSTDDILNQVQKLKERLHQDTLATLDQTATEIHRIDQIVDRHESVIKKFLGETLGQHTQNLLTTVKNWMTTLDEKWELKANRKLHEAFHELTGAVKTQIDQDVQSRRESMQGQFETLERKIEREVSVLFGNQNLIQNGFNHLVNAFGPSPQHPTSPTRSRFSHSEDIPAYRRSQDYIEERLARLRKEEAEMQSKKNKLDGKPLENTRFEKAPEPGPQTKTQETAPENERVEPPKKIVTPPPFRGKKKAAPPLALPSRPHWEA